MTKEQFLAAVRQLAILALNALVTLLIVVCNNQGATLDKINRNVRRATDEVQEVKAGVQAVAPIAVENQARLELLERVAAPPAPESP